MATTHEASAMKSQRDGINPLTEPSGTGCVECLAPGSWWFHLRRCTECGHIGCCDSSPNQHASRHHSETGHPVIASFEPGERWFYEYRTEEDLRRSQPDRSTVASGRSARAGSCGTCPARLGRFASRVGVSRLTIFPLKPGLDGVEQLEAHRAV